MIDQLTSSDESITTTTFMVRDSNILVTHGYFSEPGLIENIAQTAAARAGYFALTQKVPIPLGFIGSIKALEIHELPPIGASLETEVKLLHQVFEVSIISGIIRCAGKVLVQCEMKIVINP